MTRINSAISVNRLTDEHLLAEHREIKRMPYCLRRAIDSGSINRIPERFTLGAGHVKFFLDKGEFTFNRYESLLEECRKRGFDVQDYSGNWVCYTNSFMNDYTPTDEEKRMLVERITQRILDSRKKVWHYYGVEITKECAINMINDCSASPFSV